MKTLKHLGEWISDNILSELLRPIFSDQLELLGLGVAIAGFASIFLAFLSARFFWSLFEPPPEIRWHLLNPDDPRAMKEAYSNLHVVASLSRALDENDAQSFQEFVDQIRRLDRFEKPTIWHRIILEDDATLAQLFQNSEIVQGTARQLRTRSATSLDEFREQVRRIRAQT